MMFRYLDVTTSFFIFSGSLPPVFSSFFLLFSLLLFSLSPSIFLYLSSSPRPPSCQLITVVVVDRVFLVETGASNARGFSSPLSIRLRKSI